MSEPDRPQIREIFLKAVSRPPDDRARLLDSAGIDQNTRRDLDLLLSTYDNYESFVSSSGSVKHDEQTQCKSPHVGDVIHHYRVIRQIGSGGMGEVYLAEDTELDRNVALKLMPESVLRNRENLLRFEQEARSASGLNHPNILTVYEVGKQGTCHYLATEFVEGESLRERLRRSPVEPEAAFEIALQMASALAAAHANGIIHRDIKPENIMIRRDGLVKILDFGLAKLTIKPGFEFASPEAITRPRVETARGTLLGTLGYMSPEQTRGKDTDPRTDLWSLGCVLYEMLSGKAPFAAETSSDTIAAILTREPVPLPEARPGVPEEAEAIVTKALMKNRDERYASAEEMLKDIRRVTEDLSFAARLARPDHHSLLNWNGRDLISAIRKTRDIYSVSDEGYPVGRIGVQKLTLIILLVMAVVATLVSAVWFFVDNAG